MSIYTQGQGVPEEQGNPANQPPVSIGKFHKKVFPAKFQKRKCYILTFKGEQVIRDQMKSKSASKIASEDWEVCYNTFTGILYRQRRLHSLTRKNIMDHLTKTSLIEVEEFGGFPIVPDPIALATNYPPPLRYSEVIFVRGVPVSTTKNHLLFHHIPDNLKEIIRHFEATGEMLEAEVNG